MRNESSFGEKEGECSVGGPPLPLLPPSPRWDDGQGAVHRLRNVRFISESLIRFLCSSSHQTAVNYRGAVSLSIIQPQKMEETWQNVLIMLLPFYKPHRSFFIYSFIFYLDAKSVSHRSSFAPDRIKS